MRALTPKGDLTVREPTPDDLPVRALSPLREDAPARALTAEQEAAVARREGSLLLAAGAGSGKTSVLVERFVRAVREDGVAPARILAITFTERAAGELRERVRARLLELGEREAARDTEAAFVSTFHGFCARVLRTHPLLAGLDPDFRILDEAQAVRMRTQAFTGALGELQEREGARAVELVAAYGADRVRAMALGTYAELRSRGEREPRLPQPPQLRTRRAELDAFAAALAALAPELRAAYAERPGKRLEQALSAIERAGALLADFAETSPPLPGRLAALKLPGSGNGALSTPACEAYRAALDRLRGACADHYAARACTLLDVLLGAFSARYAAAKRARGALDFDDLELCARALLSEREDVRRGFSERFELLMVDEFQDTNRRQLAILRLLERGNLFTVGDELQAIYGFRHAEVEVFRERRRELQEQGASLALTRNFRARPQLIEAVNGVFAARFGSDFTALHPGRERADADAEPGPGEPLIELMLSDRNGWEEHERSADIAGALPASRRWRHAEARLLAQRVAELVAEGHARAGEIVVLLRAVGDLPVYERALQERGLRTLAAVGGFWGHQQVGDLLAYLRTLANPLDELALYSTLASPLVGLSSDALAILARAARAEGKSVWEAARALDAPLAPADRDRLQGFLERFAAERAAAPSRGLAELMRRAIAASGYEEHVLALDWGERRLANVHKLLRLAARYEAEEGRDLRGFLEDVAHRESTLGGAEPDAPVSDGDLDAVRLMSIHAAKGLEFPVVCVADLGREARASAPSLLVDGSRVGLRLVTLDGSEAVPALAYAALSEERRRAEAAEEERIVYVAMTRARERLLLSGAADFARWPQDRPGAPPIAWLGPALFAQREHLAVRCWINTPSNLGEVLREESLRPVARAQQPEVQLADDTPSVAANAATPAVELALSYTALSELERCGYRFYLERILDLPENRGAARAQARGGIEARARGVLVHRLLEGLDFGAGRTPTEEEVARTARELGFAVSPGEREELVALLRAAAATELAQRLASAARVRREQSFAFLLGPEQEFVTGVLDVLARELDGSSLVVDYKSDRVDPDADLETLAASEYGVQRLVYALAVLRDGASAVEVVHWYLARPHEWVSARFTAAELPQLEGELRARAARLRARGFRVSATPHRGLCLTCPGRATLCSWSETETSRELPPRARLQP